VAWYRNLLLLNTALLWSWLLLYAAWWKCWLLIIVMALNRLGEALSLHGWANSLSDTAGFLGLQVEALHLLVGISQVETFSPFDCSSLVDGSWCRCVGPATVCLYWGSIQVRLSPQCFDLPIPGCTVLVALECWKPCLFWALLLACCRLLA